jgi:hypothetical protein
VVSAAVRDRNCDDAVGQVDGRDQRTKRDHDRLHGRDLDGHGIFVGKWLKMYPIDAAIVNACHSGQGGTIDVAIQTACNRMSLMPFAQIATRIGGALTVTITLLILSRLH